VRITADDVGLETRVAAILLAGFIFGGLSAEGGDFRSRWGLKAGGTIFVAARKWSIRGRESVVRARAGQVRVRLPDSNPGRCLELG
jgi:hypothetical protein